MQILRHGAKVVAIEVQAKSVLNRVHGMPFAWSINPYRGCFHQCVFCFARRTHGFFALDGVDQWGARIFVKVNAPQVLRCELARRSWRGEHVAIGTVTDPYQPLEGRYRITRGILTELSRACTPGHLITRSPLIVRDIDVLQDLAANADFSVSVSIASLDERLARELEPTVAPPAKRLFAVRRLAEAGIRVGVAVAPVIPEITDARASLLAVVEAARDAGASFVWHSALNLGETTRDAFFAYLREHQPSLAAMYEDIYRGKYAPRERTQAIERSFAQARAEVRLRPFPTIEPKPKPAMLPLFPVSS